MSDQSNAKERKSAALRLAEEMQRRPFTTAAIGVGAAAATAGAVLGARALARRACNGKPVNQVLKTAITAHEAAEICRQQEAEGGEDAGETVPRNPA
jgi:hypothetical protein